MKKLFNSRLLGILFALIAVIVFARLSLFAADKKEARVTQVIKDVKLLGAQARPAAVNDSVREGTAVRTGGDSRAELTFTDQTLTRLGANTVFSFGEGAQNVDLASGALLMSAPRSSGTTRINTGAATAAVSGFTALWEHHPDGWCKFILLYGDGTISLKKYPGQRRDLHSGQILIWRCDATTLPEVHNIDVKKVVGSARLITEFATPLPELELILQEAEDGPPPDQYDDPTGHDDVDQHVNTFPPDHTPHPVFTGSPVGRPNRAKARPN